MKKSSLAVGAVAVLAAVWAGGAWYSGKVLEDKYPTYIAQSNTSMAAVLVNHEYRLEIKNTKLERGFFSTELEDQLIVTRLSDNKQYIVPFKSVAEHGPFPLSRLASLRLTPVMTAAHSEMIEHPSIAEVFKASNGAAPLSSDFTVSYSGQIKQHSTIAAFNYQDEAGSINSSEGKIETDTNEKGVGLVKVELDKLNFTSAQDDRTLTLNKLNLYSDLKPSDWEFISIGKQQLSVDTLAFKSVEEQLDFDLRNIKLDYSAALSGDFLDIRLNNQVDSLNVNQQALGNLTFNLDLNHLKTDALNQILEIYQTESNPNALQQKIAPLGLTLLQNQPAIHLQPFSVKNNAGENKLTFDLAMSKEDPSAMLMQGKILSLFDKLELNADLEKPAAEQLLLALDQIDTQPMSEQEIADFKRELAAQLDNAVQQKTLVSSDNQKYQAKLILENGELKLNGEVIPEQNIAQALMMLFMGGF